jgi:hypothetical protein
MRMKITQGMAVCRHTTHKDGEIFTAGGNYVASEVENDGTRIQVHIFRVWPAYARMEIPYVVFLPHDFEAAFAFEPEAKACATRSTT